MADVDASTGVVTKCSAAFGGLLASGLWVPTQAPAALCGKKLTDEKALSGFVSDLTTELQPQALSEDPFNSAPYRLSLMASYAYKFFLTAQPALPPALASVVADSLAAAHDSPVSSATQDIDVGDPQLAPVSMPMPKLTARLQA